MVEVVAASGRPTRCRHGHAQIAKCKTCRHVTRRLPDPRGGVAPELGQEVGRMVFNGGRYALVEGEGLYPILD